VCLPPLGLHDTDCSTCNPREQHAAASLAAPLSKCALSTNKSKGALAAQIKLHWKEGHTLSVCADALASLRNNPSIDFRRAFELFRQCFGDSAFWPQPGELRQYSDEVQCGMSRHECQRYRRVTGERDLADLHAAFRAALARRAEAIQHRVLGDTTLPQTARSAMRGGYLEEFELSRDVLERVGVPGQFFFHVPSPESFPSPACPPVPRGKPCLGSSSSHAPVRAHGVLRRGGMWTGDPERQLHR
jgi:hypothetical protein